MGNFEKLGILVIIVLVVVIIVVAAVGMDDPVPSKTSLAATSNVGGGGASDPQDRVEPPERPDPPRPVVRPVNRTPVVRPVPPPPPAPRKYTVKDGDRLWNISEKMYGAGKGTLWRKIAAANPTVDPANLRVGTVLIIPDVASPQPRDPSPDPAVADGRTYRIQSGDKLWNIARKTLGKGSRWPEIVAKNPGLNPDYLPVGKSINLPAR